jgi:RimJ/RimL family protein N-acetyltransferase
MTAPSTLVTPRLVVRRYEPTDLAALREAVASSLENIRMWMPNASRELSGDLTEWLRAACVSFDAGERYGFGIFLRDGTFVGHLSAIPDQHGFIELGYWARVEHLRRGYVSEAVAAIVDALSPGRFLIHCSQDNPASAGVARRTGFEHVGFDPAEFEGQTYQQMRWELDRIEGLNGSRSPR